MIIMEEQSEARTTLSMPDPEVGTRLEWIAYHLGNAPEPGSADWQVTHELDLESFASLITEVGEKTRVLAIATRYNRHRRAILGLPEAAAEDLLETVRVILGQAHETCENLGITA